MRNRLITLLSFMSVFSIGYGQTTYQFSYFLQDTSIDLVQTQINVYNSAYNITICGVEQNCLELVIDRITPKGIETNQGIIKSVVTDEGISGIILYCKGGKKLVMLRSKPRLLHISIIE